MPGDDPAAEQPLVESLLSRNVVGLLVAPISDDQSYLKPWRERTSMVFVDRRPRKLTASFVAHDDTGGTRLGINHLLDHGHRRSRSPATVPRCRRRLAGGRRTC